MSKETERQHLLSIGQFSDYTRLSIKTLRLYDAKDILKPTYVDEATGYRYYKLAQSVDARLIKILRSVGMPLGMIKAVLDAEDSGAKLEQLSSHRLHLENLIANQSKMLTHLESIIQEEEHSMPLEVNVNETPNQHVAGVRFTTELKSIKKDIAAGFGKLGKLIMEGTLQPLGVPMLVYHDVIDEESGGDVEICVPVSDQFINTEEVTSHELEGGLMASTIHKGPYEKVGPVYQKLPAWIYENGYEIVGSPREVYENDPQTVIPEELLTRVEFPVRKQ